MKMLKKTVSFIVIVAMLSMLTVFAAPMNVSAEGMVYYVDAVNGNDSTGDGSSSNPWKTINRAAGVMQSGDTCRIRSGIYRETVTPANSGADGAYITFEADTGAEVTISGAELVTGPWSVHENNIYKTPQVLNMGDWKNQVFVDGISMNLARWPNAGLDPMNPVFLSADTGTDNNKILDSELTQPDGYWNGAAVITMDKTRWSMASGMVSSYTTGKLNITNIYTHGLGVEGEYGSPYYLVGKLAALDSGNEWYYDKGTNTLYLQTPANDNPENHTVEVKARNNGFNLANKDYIRIKGLNLFACTIDARTSDYCEIDGIDAKYPSHYDFGHNGSEHYFKTSGILIGGTGNVLKNSTLAYSPGNLVTVSGIENKILNNVIHDAAYGAAYTCSTGCIWVDGTRHLVSHNTLYNSARNCISGTTIDCRIQYNHGYNAMTLLDDGGAIYLTSVDGNGTEIHHNVFHDVKANPPHFISGGIYLDFMSWDFNLYNNLTYNTNKFGIFFHSYNEFLHAYNNTFYNDSVFRMKDDGGALDGYGVRVVNNIAYEKISLARGFGIVEKNNLKVEPLFENPEAGNFKLQTASPGIDEGTVIRGITNDYTGDAPDIGAFEFGGVDWKAGHDFISPPDPSFTTAEIQYNTLLVNGFFERETDTLGGWTKTHSQTAVIERSGNDATASRHAWTRGVKLGSGEDGIEQTVTGLQPNTEYELRGFGRTATGSQEIRIGVKDFGGEEKYESISSTSWTRKKIRFTTGANETSATIYVYKSTTGGLAYADDVTLMEVDPEAPPEFEFDDDPIVTEPGITVINDRDLGTGLNQFEYVGSWGTNPSNMDAYKGDVTYSNAANDYYQVRFDGEQIRIYTEMDTNFGIIGVSIDGQPETMVDLYSSTPLDKTLVFESPVLTSGQHIMKVRITGEKNQNSGGTWVVADRVEVLKTPEMKIVNDRETGTGVYQFEYVGSWGTNPSNMDAYKGDVTYSNAANDYYQVRFEGVQISIYTEMDAHFGIIGVSIDGGDETLVDLYSSTSLDRTLVYKSPVLPSGRHILKVRVTGNKNDSSSGTWVVADRVDIALGDTETPPEQEIGVLYSQDFESTAVGTVPEGWIATTDNPVSVTQDDLGNHMLTIAESANGITSSATYNFEPIQIKMGIDFRVKAAQTSKHANFLTLKDINGTKVVELLFDLDYNHTGSHKIARRTPDNNWSNIMEYNANQWYDIHVDVDLVAGTYNVSIDDTVVVEKIPLLNAVNHVAQYVFSAYSWDKGTYHLDDITIWGPIEEEEPVYQELVNEDFESVDIGAVPVGWIAGTDDAVSVTQDVDANHRLTIVETGNQVTSAATVKFDSVKDKAIVEMRVMAEQTGKCCNFLTLKDANGSKIVELIFDQDYDGSGRRNIARRTPDGNWSSLKQYNANQWYHVRVEINLVEGNYVVFIDGEKLVEGITILTPATSIDQFSFAPHRYDVGTYHMDDLIISGIVAPQTNKAPAFSAIGDKSVNAGQMLTFTASATDADGDILFYSASNLPDGAQFDTTTGGFSWMPDENQVGNYTVSFQVSDGKLTDAVDVIITVLEAPSLPELGLVFEENFETTAVGAIPEGWAIETLGGTAAAAQMADGENLTNMALKIQRKTMNTSLFANKVFTPATGIVTIDVRMRNSQSNTLMNGPILKDSEGKDAIYVGFQRNGTFGVLNSGWQNLRPYAANQWYDIHIVADTDTDTYDLYIDGTLELKDKPFRNAVADISEIRFSPYSWDNGTVHYDNIIVKAGNVIPANEAPVINFIGSQAVNENQLLTFLVSAADANDDVLTYSALNLPEGAVFDTSTGVFTWVPGYEQAGSYSITFQVSDGSLTDSKDVDIVVNNINREPVFTAIEDKSVDEGKLLEFTILVADPDGDSITLTATNLPEGASFDTNSGVFTWMPDFSQAGEYVFNVGVTDGSLSSEVAIKVTVRNVAASEAVATLKSYMHDLGINKLSKDLLLKQLDAVTSQLNKNHSKQAMIKMKVFMLEIKILEPRVISEDIAEEILKSCLDICIAIKADAQGKDSKWVDSKLDEIIEKMRQFKKNKITDSIYEDIIKKTDELINNMKD